MNSRQEKILKAVVKEYIDTAQPVSSSILFEKSKLNVSSATIRNEMKNLEKDGYLHQPHTSAGRIPTDKGYRFFINDLMRCKELILKEKKSLPCDFSEYKTVDRLMPKVADFLAEMSSNSAISGWFDFDGESEFYKVGMGKLLRELEVGHDNLQVADIFDYLDRNIEELFDIIQEDDFGIYSNTQKSSISRPEKNSQPEDSASESLGFFEMGVRVYIGEENPIKQMRGLSMIISGRKLRSGGRGLFAILGPRRMKYDRNIALMDYIKKLFDKVK